jgi:hypothetical protein
MKINKKIFVPLLSLIMVMSACDQDFEEMNVDPNNPAEVPPTALLTNAQHQMIRNIWDQWFSGRFGMLYAQYWAQNEYTDESRYLLREGTNNNYWGTFYRALNNLEEIIRLNDAADPADLTEEQLLQADNQRAVARILQVWMFQILTDIYGPVPYSEALQGSENISPRYDLQEDIYTGLIEDLNMAISEINVDAPSFGGADIIYGGDMSQWLKFANSLKMRVGIRMADVNESAARQAVESAYQGAFESIEDAALFRFGEVDPNNNPINQAYITRRDFAVSENLIDYLLETDDPRLPYYADPNQNGEFVGLTYGLTQGEAGSIPTAAVSLPSELVRGATTPGIYMEYSEVLFILAEAAARGWNVGGTATEYYEQAIEASVQFWASLAGETVEDEEIQDLIAEVPLPGNTWNDAVENQLGRQKWVALYMQGLQGWFEWRRLDFEDIITPPAAGSLVEGVEISTRYTYPLEEQSLNNANWAEAVQGLEGGDVQSTRVWWDVREFRR